MRVNVFLIAEITDKRASRYNKCWQIIIVYARELINSVPRVKNVRVWHASWRCCLWCHQQHGQKSSSQPMSLHYINSAPWRWRRRRRGEQQSLTQLPISATSVSVEAHICIGKLFHYVSLHFPAAVAEKLSAKHSPLATGKAFNFFLYLHFFIYYYIFWA